MKSTVTYEFETSEISGSSIKVLGQDRCILITRKESDEYTRFYDNSGTSNRTELTPGKETSIYLNPQDAKELIQILQATLNYVEELNVDRKCETKRGY